MLLACARQGQLSRELLADADVIAIKYHSMPWQLQCTVWPCTTLYSLVVVCLCYAEYIGVQFTSAGIHRADSCRSTTWRRQVCNLSMLCRVFRKNRNF